ncbi:hypothetical protein BKA63DRAFT_581824 [Paraphoma chrysanthemicola]|nr:hypothetical protein BKA63DRAFT_581824 [Paraphoma chrysanthemicola]
MSAAISFHKLALSPILLGLKNAHHFISKGQAYVAAQNHDANDYLTARLRPDMLDFTAQVYRFTDHAKFIPGRVNPENPTLPQPDVEKTFPELLDRITKTKSFEGKEGEKYTQILGGGKVKIEWTAIEYVTLFAHPNFWFHIVTAYDILRMKGVDLGKPDYINGAGLIKMERVESSENKPQA